MRKRPKFLTYLSLVFIGIALSFPFQIMVIYGHDLSEWPQILNKVSLMNYLVITMALLQIPFILRASRWLLATLPLMVLTVAWNNYIVVSVGNDIGPLTSYFATGAFALFGLFVFHPAFFYLLKNPKARWWLTSPRKKVCLPIQIHPMRGEVFNTQTFDISQTGLFIPVSSSQKEFMDISPGDEIHLRLFLGTLHRFHCDAQVVRSMNAKGHYPAGIGIQFTDLDPSKRRTLKRFLSEHGFDGPRDGPTPLM